MPVLSSFEGGLACGMKVPDRCLAYLRERGYLLFEAFLEANELAAAQEALWLHYPAPGSIHRPAAQAWLASDQWAGEVSRPWRSWNLNRLAFHPDLLDLAERFLGLWRTCRSQASLWAKYAGAGDTTSATTATSSTTASSCPSAPSRPRRC